MVCNQLGKEVQQGRESEAKGPSKGASTAGVVLVHQNGRANTAKQPEQAKVLLNKKGEPLKCFNCRVNHGVMVCPLISKEEAKKIIQSRRTLWAAEHMARQAGKQQQQQQRTPE